MKRNMRVTRMGVGDSNPQTAGWFDPQIDSGSNYIYRLIDEAHVQMVFNEAKPVIVPLGEIKPPPELPAEMSERLRASPRQHFDRFIRNVAGLLGQDSVSGVRILFLIAIGIAAFLTLLFLFIWVGRRGRH